MKILVLFAVLFLYITVVHSQNALITLKLEEAEIAFNKNDFGTTIQKLDELEKMTGLTSHILYLRIVCQYNLYIEAPYKDESQYDLLVSLRVNTRSYLEGMESFGLDDKYREIYTINGLLKNHPIEKLDWLNEKSQADETIRQKNIAEMMKTEEQQKLLNERQLEEYKRKEQARKEQEEYNKYFVGAFGYYGGWNSPIGFSFLGTGRNYGGGIDLRFSRGFFKENGVNFNGGFDKIVPMNSVVLAHISKPITYPLFGYLGPGFGSLDTAYRYTNDEGDKEYFTAENSDELVFVLEGGILLRVGNAGMIRLGLSTYNFSRSELTFGVYLVIN
jgi:hypothetical protein